MFLQASTGYLYAHAKAFHPAQKGNVINKWGVSWNNKIKFQIRIQIFATQIITPCKTFAKYKITSLNWV